MATVGRLRGTIVWWASDGGQATTSLLRAGVRFLPTVLPQAGADASQQRAARPHPYLDETHILQQGSRAHRCW